MRSAAQIIPRHVGAAQDVRLRNKDQLTIICVDNVRERGVQLHEQLLSDTHTQRKRCASSCFRHLKMVGLG
jgi:hypothetical protein